MGVGRHCDKVWSTEWQLTMGKYNIYDANGSHVYLLNKCSAGIDKVYINEVLHYATYHYATSAKDNIRKVIQEMFNHQDLIAANKLLYDLEVEVDNTDGTNQLWKLI